MKKFQGYNRVVLGCDPEFFFSKKGEVIGSEKVIPDGGLVYDANQPYGIGDIKSKGRSKIVRDGVQAELNPAPKTCRDLLNSEIAHCFKRLAETISDKSLVDFSQVVEVSKEELKSLSPASRTFGCMPSYNVYDKKSAIKVDPSVYRFRSAGGHIHLGVPVGENKEEESRIKKALKNTKIMVPVLDILVGNTCVLIDRNPWAKERRKNYGRAGEHRKPKYGLEYRTLSNFWLQSKQLASFVTGMSRFAVQVVSQSTKENNYAKELMSLVDMKDIVRAIDENDFDLAMANFDKIEQFIMDVCPDEAYSFPLGKSNIKEFRYFISKGVDYWFKTNPLEHWLSLLGPSSNNKVDNIHRLGWESFLEQTVRADMAKNNIK